MTAVPWWNLRRWVQEHCAHVERLTTLVDLYRQVRDAEQHNRTLADQLRRCREWNGALLREKAGHLEEIERLTGRVGQLQARVDQAAGALVNAEVRVDATLKDLDRLAALKDTQGQTLLRALKRCDDLRAKLKSPSRRKR